MKAKEAHRLLDKLEKAIEDAFDLPGIDAMQVVIDLLEAELKNAQDEKYKERVSALLDIEQDRETRATGR